MDSAVAVFADLLVVYNAIGVALTIDLRSLSDDDLVQQRIEIGEENL